MNVLYIDKKDAKIKTNATQLFIDNQQIPFRLIDAIVMIGKYEFGTQDILRLSEGGIYVLIVSSNLSKKALIAPVVSKNAELKQKQFAASLSPLDIAKYILTCKIDLHSKHLMSSCNIDPSNDAQKIADATSIEELLGIEGSFSRYYFGYYFKLFPKKLSKGKRTKRPPLDPVNAMLSFSYMLVYNLITIRLLAFGFEPAIGFLHRPFRDHNALSSDIMEFCRADINEFVHALFSENRLTINDFTRKNGVYLKYSSRAKFWSEFKSFYDALQPKIDQAISSLRAKL